MSFCIKVTGYKTSRGEKKILPESGRPLVVLTDKLIVESLATSIGRVALRKYGETLGDQLPEPATDLTFEVFA